MRTIIVIDTIIIIGLVVFAHFLIADNLALVTKIRDMEQPVYILDCQENIGTMNG